MPPSGTTVVRDRPNQRWTQAEEAALRRGIAKHGVGKWQQIITDPDTMIGPVLGARSNVDLKDKWRNMREKPSKPVAPKRRLQPSEQAGDEKRMRMEPAAAAMIGMAAVGTNGTAATAWRAALNPAVLNPTLTGSVAMPGQPLPGPAPLQAMAEMAQCGRAWTAATEHHMMLLIAAQRGTPATQTTPPPGFAAGSSRRLAGSQSAKKLGAQLRGSCAELDAAAVSQLLLAGADADAPDLDGHTPAHALAAAAKGAQAASVAGLIVNMLLQHGGKLDARDAAGATPLHLTGDAPTAAVLLAAGAPIEAVNNAAETPLFGAAAAGAEPLIRVLAGHGANLDHQDDCGETALIRACSREDATGAALCLLEVGASVDPVDGAGRTALHAAAEAGNGTVVSVLLARGAASQIRLPDSAGESPLVLAGRNGHAQVAAQLMTALSASFC